MTDNTRDMELLTKRVESSRYIWENMGMMNGLREPWTDACEGDGKFEPFFADATNDAGNDLQNRKDLRTVPDVYLTVQKPNYMTKEQGNNYSGRARGKPRAFHKASAIRPTVNKAFSMPLISSGVSISSKESVAASHPLGFQNLTKPDDGSSESLNKIGYKSEHNKPMICNFCKNNREIRDIYLTHYLYDPKTKVLSCPVLRKHICEVCGGTGDNAHTLQYCRMNKERNGYQGPVMKLLNQCTITNSVGKIRKN